MNFLRRHWFDLGGFLFLVTITMVYIFRKELDPIHWILWISLASLFLHQLEEYRIIGTFPGMINKVLFSSPNPDRYPLNMETAFWVNVGMGWTSYFLAALFAEKAIWLGIATILVSIGNFMAHTLFFNLKGKTWFNAGMLTSILLFLPISYFFFEILNKEGLGTLNNYALGIPLGIALNYFGILKLIDWLKNKDSPYPFPRRCLLPPEIRP